MIDNFMKILTWLLLTIIVISCSNGSKKENQTPKHEEVKLVQNDSLFYGKEHYSKFQGRWQAEKDKNYIYEIKNDSLIQISNKEVMSRSKFFLLKNCDSIQDDPTMKEREFIGFYDEEENKYECVYEILSDGKKALTLMNIDNGRITIFQRMK